MLKLVAADRVTEIDIICGQGTTGCCNIARICVITVDS